MVLESFSYRLAGPIHKEPKLPVDKQCGSEHDYANATGSDPGEKANQQTETTEKFTDSHQYRYDCRKSDLVKQLDCAEESPTAEPTEEFLRTVREHNDP